MNENIPGYAPYNVCPKNEGDNFNEKSLGNLIAGAVPDDTVVMTVPARASLLEGKEYSITAGEIKRRMGSPERLSVNDLLKILKESKIPENTKNLRRKLQEQGLLQEEDLHCDDFVPTGFLSLSEEEAKEMADDFVKLTEDRFPVEEFARQMASFPGITVESAEAAIEHLNFMIEMFETDGRFDGSRMQGDSKEVNDIRRGLKRLSNASHGFAKPGFLGVYRKFKDIALELRRILQSNEMQSQMFDQSCSSTDMKSGPLMSRLTNNSVLPQNVPSGAPIAPVAPLAPASPMAPVASVSRVAPAAPIAPVASASRAAQATPMASVTMVASEARMAHMTSVSRITSGAPTASASGVAPGAPMAPMASVSRVTSGAPMAPMASVSRVTSGAPMAPMASVSRGTSGTPMAPMASVSRVTSGAPIAPMASMASISRVAPAAPMAPMASVSRAAPAPPMAPIASVSRVAAGTQLPFNQLSRLAYFPGRCQKFRRLN